MASAIEAAKTSIHYRSISLPSNCHPFATHVEEHLCRLKASEGASCSSTSTIFNRLDGLKNLYECVNDFLQLPITQHNLSGCAENVLGGSLSLLDLCSITRDAFSQLRASLQDLESCLRRREANISSKVEKYLISKKNVNKMVFKCFASFRKSSSSNLNLSNENQEALAIITTLQEVEKVSFAIFESLFSSIYPVNARSKENRWSLVLKLTKSKRVCDGHDQVFINEVHNMDMALEALYKQKSSKDGDILRMQELQKCLMEFDTKMQQYEEDLDCLFRSLIKTRVSFLNVLNH